MFVTNFIINICFCFLCCSDLERDLSLSDSEDETNKVTTSLLKYQSIRVIFERLPFLRSVSKDIRDRNAKWRAKLIDDRLAFPQETSSRTTRGNRSPDLTVE